MRRGETGIGKTELLEHALGTTPGLRRVRAVGRELETELPFTALHDLCEPLLPRLESLPAPQRAALEGIFALRDGMAPDLFRVGLAVLGLLSGAARERPIVCVVDDAQWLDHASAQAAEPLGEPALLWRAAEELGIEAEAAGPMEAAGLVELGVRVRFRHPLLRSVVYRAASLEDRRAVHRVLADVIDPDLHPDRRAWHRGRSVFVPDETVAEELEQSAYPACARGGIAAAAAFLERAAALSPDPARRAARALAAARFKHRAGAAGAAIGLLATAEAGPLDPPRRALAARLSAQIAAHISRG